MTDKKLLENIICHIDMLLTDEICESATIDRREHPVDFQVFRLLTGYQDLLDAQKTMRDEDKC